MKRFSAIVAAASMFLLPLAAEAQTVNTNSQAYKSGQVIGGIFGAIIVFLVIRKVLGSNK